MGKAEAVMEVEVMEVTAVAVGAPFWVCPPPSLEGPASTLAERARAAGATVKADEILETRCHLLVQLPVRRRRRAWAN